jgi:hypothetical protein
MRDGYMPGWKEVHKMKESYVPDVIRVTRGYKDGVTTFSVYLESYDGGEDGGGGSRDQDSADYFYS